jgi:uncharacterized protein (DUF305 family)
MRLLLRGKITDLAVPYCAVALAVVMLACTGATKGPATTPASSQPVKRLSPEETARRDSIRQPYTEADIYFMSGMIPHHAQAVKIARWVPTHGSTQNVRILAERIVVSQRDEIRLMQTWLRDRRQPVPDSNATHMKMNMGGSEHQMLMPGMLTDEELAQLDRARGNAFDRLFLTFMIRHHEGAVAMVEQLNKSPGAALDETVFRLSTDIFADQTTEIDRMTRMLAALPPG